MKEKILKNLLKNKKGETLLESIASILIFAMLMISVATIIGTSIKITQNANAKTSQWQENTVNVAVREDLKSPEYIEGAFSIKEISNFAIKGYVKAANENGVFSFYPVEKNK